MNDVLVGRDGYLFLDSGNHSVSSLFTGQKKISEKSINNFLINAKERTYYCEAESVKFINFIFPDKIYIENSFHDLDVNSLYKKWYMPRLREEGFKDSYVYLEDNLLSINNAFLKTDTHLSMFGNLAILEKMIPEDFLSDFEIFEQNVKKNSLLKKEFSGDLGRKFIPLKTEEARFYNPFHSFKKASNGMISGNDGILELFLNDSACSNKTLIIFGDSFFKLMLPMLSYFYKKIVFCRSRYFHKEIFKFVNPDIVFTGMAERYLSNCDLDANRPHFFAYPLIKDTHLKPSDGFSSMFGEFFNFSLAMK